jgi:hypothetical protein
MGPIIAADHLVSEETQAYDRKCADIYFPNEQWFINYIQVSPAMSLTSLPRRLFLLMSLTN